MSGTELCTICMKQGDPILFPCDRADCPIPGKSKDWSSLFAHVTVKPDACKHDFQGWREFEGGGEQVCTKCGMGAMDYSLRTGF